MRVANDADCFALSEASDGAGAGRRVVFGVILGTGVGGGLVVDGRLWVGPNAITGEWGHNELPWRGPSRPCPTRAATAAAGAASRPIVSGPALAADHARVAAARRPMSMRGGSSPSPRAGDAQAQATLARYAGAWRARSPP